VPDGQVNPIEDDIDLFSVPVPFCHFANFQHLVAAAPAAEF
jgi:hypothetical protein